jgi:ABC-type Fe3+/spermidine/putrescine transport system ATPase subunit
MNRGKILQIGSSQQIYEQPQSRFVADFIGETNYMDGKVIRLDDLFAEVVLDEGGKVWVTAGHDIQIDEQVHVAVRPEKIGFCEEEPDAPHGTIVDLVYIGSDTIYIIRFPSGSEMRVRSQNTNVFSTGRLEKGYQVWLTWPKESSKAFSPRYDD